MTIFDLMQSQELVAYWEELIKDEAPYPCEELFPDDKKRGIKLEWIKGARGLPIVLKTSAFDASAVPRGRIGFDHLETQMPYFKESTYIDEELRQELNMVLETGNQAYIDSVVNRIFDDEMRLLRGARASRERMRMMALTSGVIIMVANGQAFTFDYNLTHKATVSKSWSDYKNSDPIEDIRIAKEEIEQETGCVITRAMCDSKTFRDLRNNEKIKNEIYADRQNIGAITNQMLRNYIADQLDGLKVAVNDKRYKDENEETQKFMPDDTFVMFPDGALGKTWFGTTPAESDLQAGNAANVTITDMGVAVTTVQKVDPVNVETIVSMICLPSFESADEVCIIDTKAATTSGDTSQQTA
ncbi:MAG: major capsid protein [Lachnospiraceae bacterium]|nr:major capsid protein [Lachnospiraceae bacterium]